MLVSWICMLWELLYLLSELAHIKNARIMALRGDNLVTIDHQLEGNVGREMSQSAYDLPHIHKWRIVSRCDTPVGIALSHIIGMRAGLQHFTTEFQFHLLEGRAGQTHWSVLPVIIASRGTQKCWQSLLLGKNTSLHLCEIEINNLCSAVVYRLEQPRKREHIWEIISGTTLVI